INTQGGPAGYKDANIGRQLMTKNNVAAAGSRQNAQREHLKRAPPHARRGAELGALAAGATAGSSAGSGGPSADSGRRSVSHFFHLSSASISLTFTSLSIRPRIPLVVRAARHATSRPNADDDSASPSA